LDELGGLGMLGGEDELEGLGMLGDEDGLEGLGMLGGEDGLEGFGMLGDEDGLDGLGMLGDEDGLDGLGMLGDEGGLGMLGEEGAGWGLWQPDRRTIRPKSASINLFIQRARTVIILVIFQIKAELELNFELSLLKKFSNESYGTTINRVWKKPEGCISRIH
jgi:hypothetical protein